VVRRATARCGLQAALLGAPWPLVYRAPPVAVAGCARAGSGTGPAESARPGSVTASSGQGGRAAVQVVRVLVQVQSIVIFRYYDDASADFGTGTSQPIEDFARNLSNLILRLRALVCRKGGKDPITDDPLEN
jgi:hypothetical protein